MIDFRALLFGGMKEAHAQAEIPIEDVTAEAFELLLKYIYTGKLKLSDLSVSYHMTTIRISLKG